MRITRGLGCLLIVAASGALTACGDSGTKATVEQSAPGQGDRATPDTRPDGQREPSPGSTLPDIGPPISGPQPSKDPGANPNRRGTPMGTACWAETEVSFVVLDVLVPGFETDTDAATNPDAARASRLSAASAALQTVATTVPKEAQEFVTHLIGQLDRALSTDVREGELRSEEFKTAAKTDFVFDDYPGAKEFAAAAAADDNCVNY